MVIDPAAMDGSDVLAEVRAVFDIYERAVQSNDAETLIALFWNDERAVRAAPNGFLVGITEIAEFRRALPSADYERSLERLELTALTEDVVLAAARFDRRGVVCFQTQVWMRTGLGWRVAMGHVSTP